MTVRIRSLVLSLLAFAGSAGSAVAADAAASGQTLTAGQAALIAAKPGIGIHPNGPGLTTLYGPAFSNGQSAQDSAARFLREHAPALGAQYADLTARGLNSDGSHLIPVSYDAASDSYRFTLVSYSQSRDGLPVWRSDVRLLVRNDAGFPLVLVKSALKDLGAYHVSAELRAKAITEAQANEAALGIFPALDRFVAGRQVIFAGSPDVPAGSKPDVIPAPILAWEFIGNGPALPGANGLPQSWLFIVDAVTGDVVYRESLVNEVDVTGNVSGWATPSVRAAPCDAATLQPLPYARVQITGGNFAYADVNGNFTIPNAGATPVTVTSSPRGQFFRVFNQFETTSSLAQSVTPPGPANFIHNVEQTESKRAEMDGYIESNVVRDYALSFNPSFPGLATSFEFPVNVNLADTCNAFYDGTSINFFLAGGGCFNTAFSTVVYHEYGHHMVQVAGSGQGAYGEGFGDVMGVVITDDSLLGRGFQGNCSAGIRNANNTCQYVAGSCSSCGDQVHACGRLLSGSIWSVRTNLLASDPGTYRQLISDMAVNSVLLHQGTTIANDIVIDFLTLDDNDADISNGSPHYTQIANGFQAHNLIAPALPALGFQYPDGRPQFVSPSGGTSMIVQVSGITATPQTGTGQFNYNAGSGWVSVPMTQIDQNLYRADFPAVPCGTTIDYYVTARTTGSVTVANPLDAPTSSYSSVSATGVDTLFADDFEVNRNWTIGAAGDAATTGIWVRVNPNAAAAGGLQSQAEDDVTPNPGTLCFVTGNAAPGVTAGSADVDGGATTLISPVLDLSAATVPTIGYWRWYSNHAGGAPNADTLVISVSNNGGANWTVAETVGPAGPETEGGWYYHEFDVSSLVTPTANVRVRFVASDFGEGSLVEAGLDEFSVTTFLCETGCPADFDQSGEVNVPDIFAYLSAWFSQHPSADLDGVPGITVPDIFFFLSLWFTPCP